MPKAMMVLVILFVAGLGYLLYAGGKKMMDGPAPSTTEVKRQETKESDQSKADAASTARALLDKVTNQAKRTTSDAADALRGPAVKLTVDEWPISMKAGEPKEVNIRRANDAKLEALQLKLRPAANSKLTVKGGAFAKGAKETTFTIEALAAGLDASLTIETGEDERSRIVIPVRIK